MLFKATIVSAAALLFTTQAMGAVINTNTDVEARAALTATNDYAACNCPNNCKHKSGSSCAYYGGPSDSSTIIYGKCANWNNELVCIAS